MGFRKKDAKISDNKSKSAVIMGKPASQLTKEDKKLLSARMAEIKKENGSNATVQNTIPFLCMFRDEIILLNHIWAIAVPCSYLYQHPHRTKVFFCRKLFQNR